MTGLAAPRAATGSTPRTRRTRFSEFALETLIRVLGFSTIGFVGLIFLFLLREGLPVFFEVPPAASSPRAGIPHSGSSAPCP